MASTPNSQHRFGFASLSRQIKEWVRKEIVDNDPWDVESYFARSSSMAKPV
jgi:hypothetical protein